MILPEHLIQFISEYDYFITCSLYPQISILPKHNEKILMYCIKLDDFIEIIHDVLNLKKPGVMCIENYIEFAIFNNSIKTVKYFFCYIYYMYPNISLDTDLMINYIIYSIYNKYSTLTYLLLDNIVDIIYVEDKLINAAIEIQDFNLIQYISNHPKIKLWNQKLIIF